jgi:hypothetical protein
LETWAVKSIINYLFLEKVIDTLLAPSAWLHWEGPRWTAFRDHWPLFCVGLLDFTRLLQWPPNVAVAKPDHPQWQFSCSGQLW